MKTALDDILDSYRTQALTERDKGTAFEKLVRAWLVKDPVQAQRFKRVVLWSDYAREQKEKRTDVGIDLVATRHDGGAVAIQCKFYSEDYSIQKKNIDSFLAASGKKPFVERLIVETTSVAWSPHAVAMLERQTIPVSRIGLRDLRQSAVDWSKFKSSGEIKRREPFKLRCYQQEALEAVRKGLNKADRGKLIMACGTGKTLIALRIAEALAGVDRHVLVMVPSLALMAQTIREWCTDAVIPIVAFAACSDTKVGRRRRSKYDIAELEVNDLELPPTTKADRLAEEVKKSHSGKMVVVFSTYQSIDVISQAQKQGVPAFDLILCDEAHRTTGVTFKGQKKADVSAFVRVHNNEIIKGHKRLYMTATPRIYGENAKSKAKRIDATLASMDDPKLYGKTLHAYGFASAVEEEYLSDYRVIVLVMDEREVSVGVQKHLSDGESELQLRDATKIVGCWKALSKTNLVGASGEDALPMRRALAFCNSIANSKLIKKEFARVVAEYRGHMNGGSPSTLQCEIDHVDGTYNARDRGVLLDWLKAPAGTDVCRILSNARCLVEGVDVPALDAIMFLHPRNSQIDVVQAVGRVMRRAEGKRMGYVILPVGVPPGLPADVALQDNERYRVVWQILNALRAHDERLDAAINQGGLGQNVSDRIAIVDGRTRMQLKAVTAVVQELPSQKKPGPIIGDGGNGPSPPLPPRVKQFDFVMDEFARGIMAKIVEKCGTRNYWEYWAKDVAQIAERHVTRITTLVQQPDSKAWEVFGKFLLELRDDLNDAISAQDAIEMLAQHLVTRPVFDALFEGHAFVRQNPVSRAMDAVLKVIDQANVDKEAKDLAGFYASVRWRAKGVKDPQARQNLVVELYNKFFQTAFPRTTKMLGIVYTPTPVVDFIIRSVDEALREHFDLALGSEGVHILDPFAGTGTFITRLLQSGLIATEDLERKYREEIHANEIVLLAYYIAAINIETVFHALTERKDYLSYEKICLTDTFGLNESDDELALYMPDNSDRRTRQKNTRIQVIIGNPPYSAGQRSANDNAQNVDYAGLDQRIAETYASRSVQTSVKNLYDSYIRAIRWGSDRLGNAGVMAFVTGSAWVERAFADGMRKCLVEEFAAIHVFHLRGDVRKNMLSGGIAGEGENVFGHGSMTGIAISVFVKNPKAKKQGQIYFHDIGDYLSRKEKLQIISRFGSMGGISKAKAWSRITPDRHGDWLDQRDDSFNRYLKIGDKKDRSGNVLFGNYSLGIATGRDAWCINPSRLILEQNIERIFAFYHAELARWETAQDNIDDPSSLKLNDFISNDKTKISWTRSLKKDLQKGKQLDASEGQFVPCLYRPFMKQWQYYSRRFNERVYQMPRIFPNGALKNRVIAVTGKGGRAGFSALMVDSLCNLHTIDSGQCFPFYIYEKTAPQSSLLDGSEGQGGYHRRHAITEAGLAYFQEAYLGETITREDIFHYVYGLLHSEEYRHRYRTNLTKDLPRIPCVKSPVDYRAFRDAGRQLGEIHVDYESEPKYEQVRVNITDWELPPEKLYHVTKMRHPGVGRKKDRSKVIYNDAIIIEGIPEAAWEYVINGKPALSWVMERQGVKTHKASGIVSDANRYAIETMQNPRYPLDLFLRIITVSLETMKIVRALPALEID